jgi:hypothetical protein
MPKKQGRYAVLLGTFWRHAKTAKLSQGAIGVYCQCLSYCADNLTDGFVPENIFRNICRNRYVTKYEKELTAPHIRASGEVGPGLMINVDSGYVVSNYLKRNVSKSRWGEIQEYDRKRKQEVSNDIRTGILAESERNPSGIPAEFRGNLRPKTQDSLKRESLTTPDLEESEEKQIRKEDETETKAETASVIRLWMAIGKEITGAPVARPEKHEWPVAARLWARAREGDDKAPLNLLAQVFRSHWRQKHAAGKRGVLQFCLEDFADHVPHPTVDELSARREAEIEKSRLERAREAALDRELSADEQNQEYVLKREMIIAHGRANLKKTQEAIEDYRVKRERYIAYKRETADDNTQNA